MAAATLTFTPKTGYFKEPVGGHAERRATLTMVCDTSTYTDGGLADATNFKAGWHIGKLDMSSVYQVVPESKLRLSTFEEAFDFEVDLTNRKVVLYGLNATPAESEGDSEVGNGASLPNGTYTADVLIKGQW